MSQEEFENKKLIVFNKMDGMSTQSIRQDLVETKAAWMENLQPISPQNIVCIPAAAAALASLSGETVAKMYYFNFGLTTDYIIAFCNSGAAYTISNPGAVVVKFANSGTFSTAADITQWGTQRILIADKTAGYSTYDTHAFVQSGGVSPNIAITAGGTGYTSPTVAITTNGAGVGATATVQQTGGIVTGITLTAAGTGYAAADTVTFTISDGGPGMGATATGHVWPFLSVNPTTLAVFQGRVWLGAVNVLTYTGTGAAYAGVGYDDFKSADASGSFTIQDPDLVHQITALRSLNNYLFIFGDASVKQIGSISVSGSVTNFTITTLSSDQGTIFPASIVSYNRLVIFSNTVGVFAVFGSSVEKISDEMDGIFKLIDFSQLPCSAVDDINNIHCYLLLVKYKDPAGTRSLILTFMNKKWFVISQGNSLKFLVSGIVNSIYNTFGSSAADITPLLRNAAAAVNIKLITSLTSQGEPMMGKDVVRYAIAQSVGASSNMNILIESERTVNKSINYNISNVLNFVNNSIGALQFVNGGGGNLNFITNSSGFHYQYGNTGGIGGVYLGMTLTGSVQSFTLNNMLLEYKEGGAFGTNQVAYAMTL